MHIFNKSHAAPPSRQSSIYSLVSDPSASDACVSSHPSDASPTVDAPAPDSRRGLQSKRTSVFPLRSRSNTTDSAGPSLTSDMTAADVSLHRASQSFAGQSSFFDPHSPRRSLFHRGKKSSRQSTQLPLSQSLSGADLSETARKAAVLRKERRRPDGFQGQGQALKERISSPFGFQHLTHTNRNQFHALDTVSSQDLVREFSAARASQLPKRGLNGIKADDLHFHNFSSENVSAPVSRSMSPAMATSSPAISPGPPIEHLSPKSEPTMGATLRHSRSVESFSQPTAAIGAHGHTQSIAAPPRSASRPGLTPIDDVPGEESPTRRRFPGPARGRSSRNSGLWEKCAPLSSPAMGEKLATIADEESIVMHAVTTPDDTAVPVVTPSYSPELENVPEEPERFFNPRPAPSPPVATAPWKTGAADSAGAAVRDSLFFQQKQGARSSFAASPMTSPKNVSQMQAMARRSSQICTTLGSPLRARRTSVRMSIAARRQSNAWRLSEASWEDDIDYCYEHALEAEGALDWDQGVYPADAPRAKERAQSDGALQGTASEDKAALETQPLDASTTSLPSSMTSTAPEMDQSSMVSNLSSASLRTPSDMFSSTTAETDSGLFSPASTNETALTPYTEREGFALTPSLLVPPESKDQPLHDDVYEDMLCGAADAASDHHYPLLDHAPPQHCGSSNAHSGSSMASSARSSQARLSKRSSCDSSLVSVPYGGSSSTTGGAWTASSPIRRSASSAGSLPELVHSRRTRKAFDHVVDQLSEQVDALASFSEDADANMTPHIEEHGGEQHEQDDDEPTPPGRAARTFFDDSPEPRASAAIDFSSPRWNVSTSSPTSPVGTSFGARSKTPEPFRPRHRANGQVCLNLFPAPPGHSKASKSQ